MHLREYCSLSESEWRKESDINRVQGILYKQASGGVKSYIGMNGAESVFCSAFKIQAFT